MASRSSESDDAADRWAAAHGHELLGLSEEDAEVVVTAAGLRAVIFHPAPDRALAAMKVPDTVTLVSVDGFVHRVRT